MNIALWVVQVLLAVAFGMGGVMKTTRPIAELAQAMVWPGDVPAALVRFIGTAELLGAIGLLVPGARADQTRPERRLRLAASQ